MSAPGSCGQCADQRDVLTVFGEELDPTMDQIIENWHDRNHPGPGPFLTGPEGGWEKRGPGTEDALELAAVTLGPRESICAECWKVHRPGQECW